MLQWIHDNWVVFLLIACVVRVVLWIRDRAKSITRRGRIAHGLCPACGYDRAGLPQTPTGPAPCPECGKGQDDDAITR